MALLPWELRARLEREAPTHFEAPTGTMLAIDYEAEQGPTIAVRLAGIVRAHHPPLGRQRRGAAGAGTAVARAPPGAGDARPAGFLARQLCCGAFRPARPLSAASLAGGSGERDADAKGEAEGDVNSIVIARLDRATQYPAIASMLSTPASGILVPRVRGDDSGICGMHRALARPLTLRSSFSPKLHPYLPPLAAVCRPMW